MLQLGTRDLTYEDKRKALNFLGVRVEVLRKNDLRPDGTHWRLWFLTDETYEDLLAMIAIDSVHTISRV